MTNENLNAQHQHKVLMLRTCMKRGPSLKKPRSRQLLSTERAAMPLGTEIDGLEEGRLMQGTSCSSRCLARAVEAL